MKFQIKRYKEISSTNNLAKEYAAKNLGEGLVITADYQTEGRGKPGRKWISPPGKNLLFSLLLRPPMPPHRAPLLTHIACRSVADVLKRKYGLASTFKRPNDILVRGKKICGVLVEASSGSNGRLESAVIGIGLNVNAQIGDLPDGATSMKEIQGKIFDRRKILRDLLAQLKKDLKRAYAHPA